MKLKKIVSLALAGILAVSMLTACGDKGSSSSEGETEVSPVTGVAATINAELDEKADIISFTNDSKLQNVLADYFKQNTLKVGYMNNTDTTVKWFDGSAGDSTIDTVVQKMIGADGKFASTIVAGNTSEKTGVEVYALNGKKLTEENALKLVGQYIESNVNLPKDNATKTFDYAGSVAAVKAETKGGTESVWVVAVAITQTPSDK